MSGYIPTTDEVRGHYAWKSESIAPGKSYIDSKAEFDRWFDAVRAEVWDEAVSECSYRADYRFDIERNGKPGVKNPYREETK